MINKCGAFAYKSEKTEEPHGDLQEIQITAVILIRVDVRCAGHRQNTFPSLLSYFLIDFVLTLLYVDMQVRGRFFFFFLPGVVRRVRGGQVTLAAFRLHCAAVYPVRVWCEKGGRKCGEGDWHGVS